jgi:hypothetical protein
MNRTHHPPDLIYSPGTQVVTKVPIVGASGWMAQPAGPEQSTLPDSDVGFHQTECQRLETVMKEASAVSQLPEMPTGGPALSDLLVRVRL